MTYTVLAAGTGSEEEGAVIILAAGWPPSPIKVVPDIGGLTARSPVSWDGD